MRTRPSLLLPLFRSRGQADLIAHVFLHPEERCSLSELANRLGLNQSTVLRETDRLEQAGILRTERIGNSRTVHPDEESPFFKEISSLVLKAFGPVPILRSMLQSVPGIEGALIYGSWAQRYQGVQGDRPRDIDLLVVGKPNRLELARATRQASEGLGLEVNPTVISRDDWDSGSSGFIKAIQGELTVELVALSNDEDRNSTTNRSRPRSKCPRWPLPTVSASA